jgi:hypothetical protein
MESFVKCRFGILLLFALSVWPAVPFIPSLESLVRNGFLLDNYWQLGYLAATNVIAFFFAFAMTRLLALRNPGLEWLSAIVGNGDMPWGWHRIICILIVASVGPLVIASVLGTEIDRPMPDYHGALVLAAVAGGVAAGVVMLAILGQLKCYLFGSSRASANFFPFEAIARTGVAPFVAFSNRLTSGFARFGLDGTDLQFLLYLFLLAIAHHGFASRIEGKDYWLTSAPTMLVQVTWLLFMALAGIANIFDRVRVPALLIAVLAMTLLASLQGTATALKVVEDKSENQFVSQLGRDYAAKVKQAARSGPQESVTPQLSGASDPLANAAWEAIVKRMGRVEPKEPSKGKTLVVVTCPGGGIHAAAWAACVLDQLCKEYVEFKDSVCIISAVSGGSVGTLMFVGSQYQFALLGAEDGVVMGMSTEDVHRALKAESPALEMAARSSLEAIAFGLTVDDLYGLFGVPGSGRGQRLEDSFHDRLAAEIQHMTMGDWGDRAMDGSVPIVIFNATDAVTGRRILFDTVPTPSFEGNVTLASRPWNYRELMECSEKAFDVFPSTAARVSASFPYASPFTRPERASPAGRCVAMCDGGYVDNEGIVTAVKWLGFLLTRWIHEPRDQRPFDRVLLLRIEPAPAEESSSVGGTGSLASLLRWLSGPFEAMINVRSSSQIERGDLESALAALYLRQTPLGRTATGDVGSPGESPMFGALPPEAKNLVEVPGLGSSDVSEELQQERWGSRVRGFATERKKRRQRELSPPNVEAVVDDEPESSRHDPPVVIQAVHFIGPGQVVPLNWKLSNLQKEGYLLSWKLASESGTPLRRVLDQYFTRDRDAIKQVSTSTPHRVGAAGEN